MSDGTITVWVVSCWLAGTWNGLPWGMWDYVDPADYVEVPAA